MSSHSAGESRPGARKAYLFAVLAVAAWSTVAAAFKLTLCEMDFRPMLAFSTVASAAALLILLIAGGKLGQLRRQGVMSWFRSAGLGVLNPFLYYLVLFRSYELLPAQIAQPLNYTWSVVLVLLAAPILGQRIHLRDLGAIAISYAGVVVVATGGKPGTLLGGSPLGVGLALGSAFVWGLYWTLNVRDSRDAIVKLFQNFFFGALYSVSFWFLSPAPVHSGAVGFLGCVYIGLFEMGLTFYFWNRALELSPRASAVAGLVYLCPFASLALIALAVGETIRLSTLVGLAIILAGILFRTLRGAPSR